MEQNSKLVRLFAVLRTIADLGPVVTADREFAETARQVLERIMRAFDAEQGALLLLDGIGTKLTCIASNGLPSLAPHTTLPLTGAQPQAVQQMRVPVVITSLDAAHQIFGAMESPILASIRCVAPLRVSSGPVGMLILGARARQESYEASEIEGLEMLVPHLALVLHNHSLAESLRHQIADNLRLLSSLHHSYDDALEAFATTIDSKDAYLRGHSIRVARFAAGIAGTLGMGDEEVSGIRAAGHLHDIGKVTVDKQFFSKASTLRPEEFRAIADHTVMGHQIVSSVRFPWPQVPEVVRWHHERADGSGYPDRLRNDELPLSVRIVAAADTFDAMTSDRPYRQGNSVLSACRDLVTLSPSKFDASVIQALLVHLRRDLDGKSPTRLLPQQKTAQITVADIDQLSYDLVRRVTGQRVYSA
ncbi:MAG: HD domain-containing protein [Acidobacteria bacterium]|nr:HD domain-containing protein [Acidobacteriota bacterium]MBV9435346.1 HD domain-containing protein [Acidobacteriota bacterium]